MVAQYPTPTPQRDPLQMVQAQPIGTVTPVAEPNTPGAQPTAGLSPLLNQVMGTPGQMATTKPILGETRPPLAGEMLVAPTATAAPQPATAPIAAQPTQAPVSGPSPLSTLGAVFAPQQPVAAPTATTAQVPTTTAAQPPLIGQEYWTQALEATRGATPFESQYKLPTQEELSQFANTQYEQQLADLSGDVQRRQAQQAESLEQQLANRGIPVGSEAYARAKYDLAQQQASENAQLRAQARQFGEQSAQARYDRILNAYRTQMQESQLRTEQAYAGVQALGGLAGTQYQSVEQRTALDKQIAANQALAGIDYNKAIQIQRMQNEGTFRVANLDAQTRQQMLDKQIASQTSLAGLDRASQEKIATAQLENQKWVSSLDAQTRLQILDKQIGSQELLAGLDRTSQERIATAQLENQKWVSSLDAQTRLQILDKQIGSQELLAGLDRTSQERIATQQLEGQFKLRELDAQTQQNLLDKNISNQQWLANLDKQTQLDITEKQMNNQRWLANLDSTTQQNIVQQQIANQKGLAELDATTRTQIARDQLEGQKWLAKFDADTQDKILGKQMENQRWMAGFDRDTQLKIAEAQIDSNQWLAKLDSETRNQIVDKQVAADKDLAAFNRDTQMAIIEREAVNKMKAAEFDKATQKELLTMNLDQQDKQFVASMAQDDKRLAQEQYQFLQSQNLSKEQFNKSYQLQLQAQAEGVKQWQKEFTQKIAQDKFLNKLQKDQLAEMVRSNKADEATKRYIADRARSGSGAMGPQEQAQIVDLKLQATEKRIRESGMSEKEKAAAIRNLYGASGTGGIARAIGQ